MGWGQGLGRTWTVTKKIHLLDMVFDREMTRIISNGYSMSVNVT